MPSPLDRITKVSARIQVMAQELDQHSRELEAIATELETASPTEAASSMWVLSEAHDELDTARKMVYAVDDKLNKFTVPTVLQKADLDLIRVPGLARSFYITPKYSASIVADQRGPAMQWLRDNGLSALIQETVNAGTLTSAIRDRIVNEGKDVPEELIMFRTYNTTGSSKYKPK